MLGFVALMKNRPDSYYNIFSSSSVFFRSKSSSELILIFIYFSSNLSELLVVDLIGSLLFFPISSHLL